MSFVEEIECPALHIVAAEGAIPGNAGRHPDCGLDDSQFGAHAPTYGSRLDIDRSTGDRDTVDAGETEENQGDLSFFWHARQVAVPGSIRTSPDVEE